MRDPMVLMVVASGMALGLGLWLLLGSAVPRVARLGDALDLLDPGRTPVVAPSVEEDQDWATRWGNTLLSRLNIPVGERTRRILALQGRSVGDWITEKCILAALGLASPVLLVAVLGGLGRVVAPLPLGASLVLGFLGWMRPSWRLGSVRRDVTLDAGEALHTFMDLVVLNRLANCSATQSLTEAAAMSDHQVFLRIRGALERARLEQRPPWTHLRALSHEMGLVELAEVAEVMQLDEQGAALADALRARVADLRDSHLLAEKVAAQQLSERMTLWMVLPTMVFALFLLAPPLLRMAGLA